MLILAQWHREQLEQIFVSMHKLLYIGENYTFCVSEVQVVPLGLSHPIVAQFMEKRITDIKCIFCCFQFHFMLLSISFCVAIRYNLSCSEKLEFLFSSHKNSKVACLLVWNAFHQTFSETAKQIHFQNFIIPQPANDLILYSAQGSMDPFAATSRPSVFTKWRFAIKCSSPVCQNWTHSGHHIIYSYICNC